MSIACATGYAILSKRVVAEAAAAAVAASRSANRMAAARLLQELCGTSPVR